MLDDIDGDENLEPSLGGYTGDTEDREYQCEDEGVEDDHEEENEHGGDINDAPHDQADEGNDEPNLGRLETIHQGAGSYVGASDDTWNGANLQFDGDGYLAGREVLRNLQRHRPDVHQEYVATACGIGDRNALKVDGLSIRGTKPRNPALPPEQA